MSTPAEDSARQAALEAAFRGFWSMMGHYDSDDDDVDLFQGSCVLTYRPHNET